MFYMNEIAYSIGIYLQSKTLIKKNTGRVDIHAIASEMTIFKFHTLYL